MDRDKHSPAAEKTKHAGPPATRRRRLPAIAAVLLVAILFAALYAWWAQRSAGPAAMQRPPVAVAAMQLVPTDVPVTLEAIGNLRAAQQVLLAPETAGRVVAIAFGDGESVEEGQLLLQLFDAPERADRAAAQARAALAKAQLRRSGTLVENGAESRETLDVRTAERDQALAAVQQWEARLEQKQIRAPFAGRLGIRQVDLGQYLQPGDGIVTLTDTSRLFLDFSLPQRELRRLAPGMDVIVSSDAWPGRRFRGAISSIEARVNPDTRNISLRALLRNEDDALRPGMFVQLQLQLPDERDRLVVPSTAIQTTAAGDSVVLIRGPKATEQGPAESVRVTVSRRLGDRAVVSEGLQAGDVIVTEGQLRIPPGATVQVSELQRPGEY